MLHIYTDHESPNGYKTVIALEELGQPYQIHPINLANKEHKTPEFLAMNPHGRVPVLRDDASQVTIFESGAILLYLAQQHKALLPEDTVGYWQAVQWMVYHSASVGPTIGQHFNFAIAEAGRNEAATARFERLKHEAFTTLDQHLAHTPDWFVKGYFSIADIANFGWFYSLQEYNVPFTDYPHIQTWFERVSQRPAVQRALNELKALPSK